MRWSKIKLFIVMMSVLCNVVYAGSIPVPNYSFENPPTTYVDPIVPDWDELDNSPGSENTGVFYNYPGEAYITNADANQVAYLIGQEGNAFQQELAEVYKEGKNYRMTVGVCISLQSRPPAGSDPLEMAFYYLDDTAQANDIATTEIPLEGRTAVYLDDFSVDLNTVQAGDPWVGKQIGIAIRARGSAGGAWDLDNVRVTEYPLVPNFTDDSIVNLVDFSILAADWLFCDDPLTDVTGDGCVDEADLLILIEYWLDEI